MAATVSDFAVRLAAELSNSLYLEQQAHVATREALGASERVRVRLDRWNTGLRWALALCAAYASAVTGLLVAGWMR